jgi:predicted GNAT superfamily acetyltransferase
MAEVRALTAHQEFGEAVRLQRQIWGFEDVELLPARLFVVATKIGGQVLGAFDGARMVGFCIAIPGVKRDGAACLRSYLHSHMLGVLPEYRNAGIGRALKLAQREQALARGIDLVEWTFDPLELKNAFFNVERLGAIARRYVQNQYGATSSPLHGGLPTDRCVAEWWLRSSRVDAILARGIGDTQSGTRIGSTGVQVECPPIPLASVRVSVPANIADLRTADPERARAIQAATGEAIERAFAEGLAVIGFERTEEAGTYLLGQWEPQ